MPLATRQIVTGTHWFVLTFLALLIAVLLLLVRDGHLLTTLISSLLIISTYLVLLLLYEVDNNFFGEEALFETTETIFSDIGRLPYFPDYVISQKRVKVLPAVYRSGTFADPARPKAREIHVLTVG